MPIFKSPLGTTPTPFPSMRKEKKQKNKPKPWHLLRCQSWREKSDKFFLFTGFPLLTVFLFFSYTGRTALEK